MNHYDCMYEYAKPICEENKLNLSVTTLFSITDLHANV